MNSMKRQNDRILKKGTPLVPLVPNILLNISGEITAERTNNGWRKAKQYTVVDVTGDRGKVQCCKEQ